MSEQQEVPKLCPVYSEFISVNPHLIAFCFNQPPLFACCASLYFIELLVLL